MAGYKDDIPIQGAWDILKDEPGAALIDVRTAAEWQFVGVPILDSIGKQTVLVEWIRFPGGAANPDFVQQVVDAVGDDKDASLLFLCRSGQRSQGAATALTQAGYTNCYNILEGFEGDKDTDGHRGRVGGWKVAGLPWAQG
ncbi:MAG: rhodanese-like domain-containing protein [Alphaproteobacteria bacterium]